MAYLNGAEWQGATEVLRKAEALTNTPAGKTTNELAKLKAEFTEFRKEAGSLDPTKAAEKWLGLADRRFRIASKPGPQRDNVPIAIPSSELAVALPPPVVWTNLYEAIFRRKPETNLHEIGLKLLAGTLTGDRKLRDAQIGELHEFAASLQGANDLLQMAEALKLAAISASDDPDGLLKTLEIQMTGAPRGFPFRVPNVVPLAGREKTAVFLREALRRPGVLIEVQGENETSKLARKIALEMVDLLKEPPWGLINSVDSLELYEAIERRFEGAARSDNESSIPARAFENRFDGARGNPQMYYIMGLIANGRITDALSVARRRDLPLDALPVEGINTLEASGHGPRLEEFLFQVLTQRPGLPFWENYVALAARQGKTTRMLALVRAAAAREDLPTSGRLKMREILLRALLASDEVEEAIEEMRRLSRTNEEGAEGLGNRIAGLGVLLGRKDLLEEGIQIAKQELTKKSEESGAHLSFLAELSVLNSLLSNAKRGAEGEPLLEMALQRALLSDKASQKRSRFGTEDRMARIVLEQLAVLYDIEGRSRDVMILLEEAPYWRAKDLAELRGAGVERPMAYIAARALVALGRKEEARKVLLGLLAQNPGFDGGYELLLAMDGTAAVARLDEMSAQDPFEERPLIWKGELLRREGKFGDAERAIRKAISIDPSDGEEGPGDRMRAYSVLANVREARGDQKEADSLWRAIRAIRMSEQADKLYSAGLLKRAVSLYEESLREFADAYCIQSRLAMRLAEMGKYEEAEIHYRRAFELMPESFGRVESHCFGCEGVFQGEIYQQLAGKIFQEMIAKTPGKPQLHYLLGYLRQQQGRPLEALAAYREAVRLDPDYLNAWAKLASLREEAHVGEDDNDAVILNILRLDPGGRHAARSFEQVKNLPALWRAMEEALARQPARTKELFPLKASRIAEEKTEANSNTLEDSWLRNYRDAYSDYIIDSPGKALAQNAFIKVAVELIAGRGFGLD